MPDFTPNRHRDAITRRGEKIRWFRGDSCTCNKQLTGLRNRECVFCGGLGIVYTEQAITDYRALVRDVSISETLAPYGKLGLGDITITTMPDEIPISEADRIELVERKVFHEDVGVCSGTTHDDLRWQPLHSIVEVAVGDADERKVYTSDEYSLDDTGITWAVAPAANKTFVIKYYAIPQYVVLTGAVLRRRTVGRIELPQRAAAKLRGLDYRE